MARKKLVKIDNDQGEFDDIFLCVFSCIIFPRISLFFLKDFFFEKKVWDNRDRLSFLTTFKKTRQIDKFWFVLAHALAFFPSFSLKTIFFVLFVYLCF